MGIVVERDGQRQWRLVSEHDCVLGHLCTVVLRCNLCLLLQNCLHIKNRVNRPCFGSKSILLNKSMLHPEYLKKMAVRNVVMVLTTASSRS